MKRNRLLLFVFFFIVIVLLCVGAYIYFIKNKVYEIKYLEPEVYEDIIYDSDLLIGRWQSGTLFYIFDFGGIGTTWDVGEDILEAEASHLKWELKSSQFIHYYEMDNGGVIPKLYKIKYLDLNKLIFIDEYANEFVFVKVME